MKQAEKDSKVKVAALRAQAIAGENEAEMKGKSPQTFSLSLLKLIVI